MIDFLSHIRKFENLDGIHWLTISRGTAENPIVVTPFPVRCFIATRTTDNPNIATALVSPIITSLDIYTFPFVDIMAGDFLTVQKRHYRTNELIGIWNGIVNLPEKYQTHQRANMEMRTIGDIDIPSLPPPTQAESVIHLHFLNLDHLRIRDSIMHQVVRYKFADIPPLYIDGFIFDHAIVNGVREDLFTGIEPVEPYYSIELFYDGAKLPSFIQCLVNSTFTRANGTSGSGWHLYARQSITGWTEVGGLVEFTMQSITFTHETTFRNITIGTTFGNNASNIFITIVGTDIEWWEIVDINGNVIMAMPYTPTIEQADAYMYQY